VGASLLAQASVVTPNDSTRRKTLRPIELRIIDHVGQHPFAQRGGFTGQQGLQGMQRRFRIKPGVLPRRIENQRPPLIGSRLSNDRRAQPHLLLNWVRLPDRREKQ
jgi:hypothetical protein